MSTILVGRLKGSSIRELNNRRSSIQVDPPYQRFGEIWPVSRRQLLIDSILRAYDIPKLYFRAFVPPTLEDGRLLDFAIIDGRQRLEAIWDFVDDAFPVEDVELPDADVPVGALRFSDLRRDWPDAARRFLDYKIDVVTVETDDLDLIEDMFLRLNEAAPLNAAEKRNAFGGPIPPIYKRICQHRYFTGTLPFPNRRYRHYDMATKFLYFEERHGVADTKKTWLDRFVRSARQRTAAELQAWESAVNGVLTRMAATFGLRDQLLTAVGMSSVYYLVFRQAMQDGWDDSISRDLLLEFERLRYDNRIAARIDEADADYDLLEFDRFAQSPNDAVALRFRRNVLLEFLGHPLEPTGEDE